MFLRSTRLIIIAIPHLVEKYYEGVNTSSNEISEIYNINSRALMVSLRRLTQVGVLKSQIGGVHPGFMFVNDPKNISMYDIIIALEGVVVMEKCRDIISDVRCSFDDCLDCVLYKTVNVGINNIHEGLKRVSLYDYYNTAILKI